MKQIYTTTLRLNLCDEDDRRAFEYLQRVDKKQYRSCNKAIVAAINNYFERQERIAADPYLETREKEDAFLQRITETIKNNLKAVPAFVQPNITSIAANSNNEELSAALDFADSF